MTQEKQIDFPPLPNPTWVHPESMGHKWDMRGGFTEQQMRDYVAADRAQRQAEPASDLALQELTTLIRHHTDPEAFQEIRQALLQFNQVSQRQAEQEDHGFIVACEVEDIVTARLASPQAERQPLTEAQLDHIYKTLDGGRKGYPALWSIKHLARQIEAAHGIQAVQPEGTAS